MSNPYSSSENGPQLCDSWFCFLDVLGFTEILKKNELSTISEFHSLLRRSRSALEGRHDDYDVEDYQWHKLTAFTDNIVLGVPISGDGESESGLIFDRLAEFQLNMVLGGFFIRGGLSFGGAYIDDYAVYGPALLDAHTAESKIANDPRIVLTDSAKTKIQAHLEYYTRQPHAPQNHFLKKDRDGAWFVNYLEQTILDLSSDNPVIAFDAISRHAEMVSHKLQDFQEIPRIWRKYEWVARYHNDFCRSHEEFIGEDYAIEIETLTGGFRSILDT